jgi:hypothetical protein
MIGIAGTISTPSVEFSSGESTLRIVGESYPENSFQFYAPLFSWLKTNLPLMDKFILEINIPYMNSSSTKCILDILDMLADRVQDGGSCSVRWLYEAGNDRAFELAKEFEEDMDIPFDILPLEPKQ